ncbi:MAG: hypothetical protein JRG69_11370 [Deltaproteobacteria bacterium]|nr:hypothetical protein [Deltaproteobacteria bacterium]
MGSALILVFKARPPSHFGHEAINGIMKESLANIFVQVPRVHPGQLEGHLRDLLRVHPALAELRDGELHVDVAIWAYLGHATEFSVLLLDRPDVLVQPSHAVPLDLQLLQPLK